MTKVLAADGSGNAERFGNSGMKECGKLLLEVLGRWSFKVLLVLDSDSCRTGVRNLERCGIAHDLASGKCLSFPELNCSVSWLGRGNDG